MSHLLDTNICSAHIKRPSGLIHYFVQHSGRLFVPTPVLGELYTWAYQRDSSHLLVSKIENELLPDITILSYDEPSAIQFGRLNGHLLRRGITVSPVDLMIAAIAIANDLTLVTHNSYDFRNVPDLRLEDWLAP